MGLDGASSNQNSTAHERLALLNSTREAILDQVGVNVRLEPSDPTRDRIPKIRRSVESLLMALNKPVRRTEILPVLEDLLGIQVQPSTVKAALCDLAAMADSPVERVGYGLYVARPLGDRASSDSATAA